jgi:AAHS family 4-hydroxybenzoate transporter-like MFS transporter
LDECFLFWATLFKRYVKTREQINISELIDNTKIGSYHVGLCILTGICLIVDGFDVQAMGYVAPAIIRDWKVAPPALGPVFSAALVGVLIGSLLFSMLADRVGRRPVLIAGTLFFGVMTLLTGRVNTINELLLIRFIAGMGLGGIMPNVVALMGEFSPAKSRLAVMTVIANGFNVGAAFGGFVAASLIPSFGWRSVFYVGGSLPLLIGVLMFVLLPESLQFMVVQGKRRDNITKWLKRLEPNINISDTTEFIVEEEKKEGVPIVHLFSEGRGAVTILLWIVFFCNLLNLFLLASWLPTLVNDLGYTTQNAVLVGTTLQVAGLIAGFVMAAFMRRLGLMPILTTGFVMGCISIALIGQVGFSLGLLFLFVFLAGWGIVGNQGILNALAGSYYPTYLRSTGVGWCLGIGRIGAIVGPLFAGELLRRQWTNQQLFIAAASLAFVGVVAMLLLWVLLKPTKAIATAPPVITH